MMDFDSDNVPPQVRRLRRLRLWQGFGQMLFGLGLGYALAKLFFG